MKPKFKSTKEAMDLFISQGGKVESLPPSICKHFRPLDPFLFDPKGLTHNIFEIGMDADMQASLMQ